MHHHRKLFGFIYACLKKNMPVVLLYVLESAGSSPGRQGFAMAVNKKGKMCGSIGGGIMEHKFVEMAKKKLQTKKIIRGNIKIQIHNKAESKNQSGMICGGRQSIFIYRLKESDIETIIRILLSLNANTNGTLELSNSGFHFLDSVPEMSYNFNFQTEDNWLYQEKTGYKNQLSIIGGGHCVLAFSKLMHNMDFYIRLYEHRSNLNTMVRNIYVHEKIIVANYSELANKFIDNLNQYVVVMTFGYRTDYEAVKQLLKKNFTYFGLLGSRSKIQKMFSDYIAEGIEESRLAKIFAPVGIGIKSQTPAEIAVSIAAQIILVKNENL